MRGANKGPFRVSRVEPPDGSRGVLRDGPVVLLLSGPVDADRLREATLEVREAAGPIPARVQFLDGGRALAWWPQRDLRPGHEHRLVVEGLRDRLGREAPPLESRFTPGPLASSDLER